MNSRTPSGSRGDVAGGMRARERSSDDNDNGQLPLHLETGQDTIESTGTAMAIESESLADAAAMPAASAQGGMIDTGEGSLGQHLRAAREARGWTREEVATRLKLPVRLIARIEADDYQGMTQGVYLRGYLISYTRLLDLPTAHAERVADLHTEATPIVATGTVPRSRYLLDRYSVTATYLILTGLILGPTVWFAATRGGIEQSLVRTTPLDTAALQTSAPSSTAPDTIAALPVEVAPAPLAPPRIEAPPPVVASMAPFSTRPAAAPAPSPVPAAEGGRTLVLKVSQASWVEVLDADGKRLEYGLLQAGTERSYRSERPLSVRLGNADGVELQADGAVVDLAPYRRANVAHVRVFGSDATVARIEP